MKRLIIILIALSLTACAAYRPIVDRQSITDQGQYERDLAECQAYSKQVDPGANAAIGMAGGAAVGAALGALVGAFFGCPGKTAAFGAALGGAQGLGSGAGYGIAAQRDIVRRCMMGRGYAVLH